MAEQFRRFAGFDESDLERVLSMVNGSDVLELEIAYGKSTITLRRGADGVLVSTVLEAVGAPEPPTPGALAAERLRAITSPLVGIFQPEVRTGDTVTPGQLLGTITAMGMPTSVDAPEGGAVEEVLAGPGSPVEYGQALLVLRRAGD
jgi:biotin carboxyl carrier protein